MHGKDNDQSSETKATIYLVEVVYILGSLALASIPIFIVWKFEIHPTYGGDITWNWIILSVISWAVLPVVIFTATIELYVKRVKKISSRLQKYGFLGRGYYRRMRGEA